MKTFNPLEYAPYNGEIYDDSDYRVIPCSDWLPADFESVMLMVSGSEKLTFAYYSPSHHCFFRECSGSKIEITNAEYWLKKVT